MLNSWLPLPRIPRSLPGTILWVGMLALGAGQMGRAQADEPPQSQSPELQSPESVSFELDIQPIMAARGCSTGPCHGKARGQNGFQLSLLSFDPDFDYDSLTSHARGRRIFPAAPAASLLLRKATVEVPHGGGRRFEVGSEDYRTLLQWIRAGTPRRIPDEPQLTGISVSTDQAILTPHAELRLEVTAAYSDGTSRPVTSRAQFESNESAVAAVDATGRIKAGPIPGEATIMARYMGLIATCAVAIPLAEKPAAEVYAALPRYNFIDELVWAKLQSLNILPSGPVDDARFLRRAHLDIIGRLPTPEEIRSFLADSHPGKRQLVVERLLERPEYADHWANKWADLLRPNPYRVGIKAVLNYDQWIRDSFRHNKPYDQFVRELVTARGSTWRHGATTLFRDRRSPDELATITSQLFLGIRLECAKCHHHPSEKWSQDDFYRFAAYFARVGRKGTGLSPPISGGEEMVFVARTGEVRHPRTNELMEPAPLFGSAPAVDEQTDPRQALAEWMTADSNEYFVQVIANRVWAELMGRGLTEPVDDLRATNPPSNGPLLAALGNEFRKQGYDLKQLIRTIATSYVYGLSSDPNPQNLADTRNHSRHYRTRLRAEVLADAVCDITGTRDGYEAMPPDSRANQIWTHRVDSLFLDTFGRPDPNQDPPCERTPDTTVTQTLHLMNAPAIQRKIMDKDGRLAALAAGDKTPDQLVEEVYLWVYGRLPSSDERQVAVALLDSPEARRRGLEDLVWAMLNTPEFIFKD